MLLLVFLLAVVWLLGLTQKLPRALATTAPALVDAADVDGDGLLDAREDALLARHRPVFLFAADEPSLPASIPWIRARADWSFDGPRLAGALLPTRRFDADTRRGSLDAADRRLYAHAYPRDGGGLVLQYWSYYPYNDGPLFFDHESDWEHVSVLLDADEAPVEVAYARHEENAPGVRRGWHVAAREGERPVVLVARGTHAAYGAAAEAPFWERVPDCPRVAGGGLGPGACDQLVWRPDVGAIVNVGERTAPRTEREADAFFVRWAGLWGEPATVLGSAVPPGPPFQRGFCAEAASGACR